MKKLLALILIMGAFLMTTACTKTEPAPTPQAEPQTYTAYGRYYTDGSVVTNDGDIWGYQADTISDKTPYDAMPVWVGFSDNSTPDNIYDDIILGLVYDHNTAIYDELETTLSDSFELERDGNNIKIKGVQ